MSGILGPLRVAYGYPIPGAACACCAEVANLAELAILPVQGFELGAWVWVETLRTYVRLALTSEAGALVPWEVFAAALSTFRWVRMETPVGAWQEAIVYIDSVNGNNENPGTALLPIADAREWHRRNPVAVLDDYEMRFAAGAPIVDVVGSMRSGNRAKWTRVKITGTPTVVASGAVATVSAPVQATNTEAKLSGPVADWAPYVTAQSVLRTLLPSNFYAYSAVGTQAVLGTAETGPWVTASPNTAGLLTATGTNAAPAVGATVEVLTLPTVTGEFRLTYDSGISVVIETLDLSTVPGQLTLDCRVFYYVGCRFVNLPAGTASQCPSAIAVGGVIPGSAASTFFTSLRFVTFIGTVTFRTMVLTAAESTVTMDGLCAFGAGITIGNTVGGAGPSCVANLLNGGGGCQGAMAFDPVANGNSNPGADCFVVRGGAWLQSSGASAPFFGRANGPAAVFLRVWGLGLVSMAPGYTSAGTGTAGDFALGAFGASAAAVEPPIELLVAGNAPAMVPIPAAAGAGWTAFNAATPAGFSRYINWRGSVIAGAQ